MELFRIFTCRAFLEHANWNISVISINQHPSKSYQSDIQLFVVPKAGQSLLGSHEVLSVVENNPSLLEELHKYGYVEAVSEGG